MQFRSIRRACCVLPLVLLTAVGLVWAQQSNPWQNKQAEPIELGTSGGNANDISHAFCCSGTLGSLVTDGSASYILSNNHVLADTDTAAAGDNIIQPGLVDISCQASNAQVVANLSRWSALGSQNVDAAIAETVSGAVSESILGIGTVSDTEATPAVNLAVAKSGRTTQLTCASISSIDTNVSVQYQQGCGSGKKFVITYTNQIVINSSSFSAAGDSGSLIVTQTGVNPVGLLYAGSSTTTIANPIQEVTNALGVSFPKPSPAPKDVTCSTGGGGHGHGHGNPHGPAGVSQDSFGRALAAKNSYAASLMTDPAILGVGVGASPEDPSQAVVMIYLEQGRMHGPIPTTLDGVRTEVIRTDLIRAYGWNEPERKACTVR
jgi:hypothetical protein